MLPSPLIATPPAVSPRSKSGAGFGTLALLGWLVVAVGCSESTPIPPIGAGPNYGASCAEGCGRLSCLEDPRFPGGYCTSFCTETDCEPGARCTEVFGPALCLAECGGPDDCRAEYQCFRGVCRPSCATDTDCGGEGAICLSGLCSGVECRDPSECGPGQSCTGGRCLSLPDGGLDGGAGGLGNGENCTRSVQCDSGVCAPADRTGADPSGICVIACTNQEPCSFDDVCAPVPLELDGAPGPDLLAGGCIRRNDVGAFLAQSCTGNEDCSSRTCVDGQCTYVCATGADCLPGHSCTNLGFSNTPGLSFRGCGYDPADGIDTIELGDVVLAEGVPSERVNLAVPSDVSSITLLASQTAGAPGDMSFISVTDPLNQPVFDISSFGSWIDPPVRWYPNDGQEHIQMLIPNTTPDRAQALPGRYGITTAFLGMTGGGTIRLRARIKRAPTPAGTLNLNVFLVGVGINAGNAASDGKWAAALAELGRIYGAANVTIGDVRYFDITGADAGQYSIINSTRGPDSEMAALLRLSGGRTENAANVFLVRAITEGAGSGGITLGVAGGIPGPPAIHGTMHSGVIVSFDPMVVGSGDVGSRNVAQIMSHELGHYLGLFHNRENAPPCPAGTGPSEENPCAPFGGNDVLEDTNRNDGDNLMWFTLGGNDGRTYNVDLSDGQGLVMRHSALVTP